MKYLLSLVTVTILIPLIVSGSEHKIQKKKAIETKQTKQKIVKKWKEKKKKKKKKNHKKKKRMTKQRKEEIKIFLLKIQPSNIPII